MYTTSLRIDPHEVGCRDQWSVEGWFPKGYPLDLHEVGRRWPCLSIVRLMVGEVQRFFAPGPMLDIICESGSSLSIISLNGNA